MSEQLASKTLAGIYQFCQFYIEEENVKNQILNHINNIFNNWTESWNTIKEWLQETQFQNKEQDLLSFIEKIPEFKIFQNVILAFLKQHINFWDTVYSNLQECKILLNPK